MLKTGFIGAGTVGTALAILLDRQGHQVTGVYSRTRTSAENLAGNVNGCRVYEDGQGVADNTDLVFITTPDDAIAGVASRIKWRNGQSVVHCSGADSADSLEPAKKAGAMTGSFHPLQTFAGIKEATENIPGSTFGIEAVEPLLSTLKDITKSLGGSWIELKASDKVAYHTAAVMVCNYLVTLVKMATDLWETFSVPPDQATKALMPLLRGTLHNIDTIGIPQCLTGPIARGDTGTIKKHLEAFKEKAPALLSTYRELGSQTVPIALAKGKINEQQAAEIEKTLGISD